MPFRRRYKNRDTTDEGGSGSRRRRRGWPPGWGKYQGAGGGLKDLVDFLQDFREWRAQKYDRTDNREYRYQDENDARARKIELINDALDIIRRIRDRRDGGLCTNMKEQLEDMKEKAAEAAQKAAEAVTEKLNEAKEQVEEQIQKAADQAKEVAEQAAEQAAEAVEQAAEKATEAAEQAAEQAEKAVEGRMVKDNEDG